MDSEVVKVTELLRSTEGVSEIEEVEYESVGVNAFTVRVASEDVRKPLMSKLLAADCMVLEITTEKPSLEEAFVKLTAPTAKQTRDEAFEELGKQMDAAREAEEAAKKAAEETSAAEDTSEPAEAAPEEAAASSPAPADSNDSAKKKNKKNKGGKH